MKKYLLLIALCPSLLLFSQTKISGQVVDKQTDQPVPYVIIYTADNKAITMTDDDGRFNLDVNPSEPVYFKQLAYDFFTALSDSIINTPKIYLTKHVIELNEVVVSPDYARNLLQKDCRNTDMRTLRKKAIPYLFHFEGLTSTGGELEMYALIDVALNKVDKKKKDLWKYNWKFHLIQMDKIKEIEEKESFAKKIPFFMPLFPMTIALRSDYMCEIQERNGDTITIKIFPLRPDKFNCRYSVHTINMQDTTLIESTTQSLPDIANLTNVESEKIQTQILTSSIVTKYIRDESTGLYHYQDVHIFFKIRVREKDSYTIYRKISAHQVSKFENLNGVKKRKILPEEFSLFRAIFPNSPGFWKKYVE
jgi:hypothetical protein